MMKSFLTHQKLTRKYGEGGGGGSKCHSEFWKILQFFAISPHNANVVELIFSLKQAQWTKEGTC